MQALVAIVLVCQNVATKLLVLWFQNNPEICAQSEATEINNLIQSGALSPVYNGPAQSNLNESSRHINMRFHALRSKADCEADFLTKPIRTPQYEQLRRDILANENY